MKKFVVSFISALLLSLSFISVIPASALKNSDGSGGMGVFVSMCLNKIHDELGISPTSYIAFYSPSRKEYSLVYLQPDTNQRFYWVPNGGNSSTLQGSQFWISDYDPFSSSDKCYRFYYQYNDRNQLQSAGYGHLYNFNANIGNRSNVPTGVAMHVGVDSDNGADTYVYYHNAIIYDISTDTSFPPGQFGIFEPPVNAKFDFKSDIEFFCCLKDNVSLPCDNRVWIEVYDSAPAIEKLIYKPHKYVYTKTTTSSSPDIPNKHEQVIGDYLLANSVGPYYSISVDTLLHAGCSPDSFYTARAYVYNNGEPYEIANLTFKISSDGLSTVDTTLHDPDHPDDPIMKTWNNDNRTYNYYNVNTGAEVDKDKLVYKFDSSVDPSVTGSGQDISDFDFNSDFSTDLTQGAGLVRTLFDKIIQSMGLSGFMITVLSVAVVGWFIFGSRR